MTLAARQVLLARFLDDPATEAAVRGDPRQAAQVHAVPLTYARWLASLEPQRVDSFRRGQAHKAARRGPDGAEDAAEDP